MNVELKSLTKRFGAVTAVQDLSAQIHSGESFFLLGPSGCGKTTLLRMIAGFCAPDEGNILFDGKSVNALPPHRRNVAMVFQNYALWPHLRVFDNVAFGLRVPGRTLPESERRVRVQRVLTAMHLEHLARHKPNQLSGGEQQRVALARALVVDPAGLLLDEPLSNLDAKLRLEMRVEIRSLVKRLGITTIYVTHDQKEALTMADRCAVLAKGRLEQVGTPRDLYERPANRFVADFIGGANLVPGTIRALTPLGAIVATGFGEFAAHNLRDTPAPGAKVILAIRSEALRLGAPSTAPWSPEAPPSAGKPWSPEAPPHPGGQASAGLPAVATPQALQAGKLNSFKGRLVESIYSGDTTESWIKMSDGFILKALSSPSAAQAAPAAEIPLQVNPADVLVLME